MERLAADTLAENRLELEAMEELVRNILDEINEEARGRPYTLGVGTTRALLSCSREWLHDVFQLSKNPSILTHGECIGRSHLRGAVADLQTPAPPPSACQQERTNEAP